MAIFVVACGLAGMFGEVAISGGAAASGRGFTEDPRRLIIFGLAYVWALVWLLSRFSDVVKLAQRIWLLWVLVAYAAASMLWSPIPFKVFINCGHYAGETLVALAAVCAVRDDLRRLVMLLVTVLGSTVVVSVIAVRLGWPNSLDAESGRWAGIAGNANALGFTSAIVLGAAANIFLAPGAWFVRLGSAVLGVAAALALRGSGSATSLIFGLVLTAGVVWFQFGRNITNTGIATRVATAVVIVFLVAIVAITFMPQAFEASTWLGMLGKDGTLTGRTYIWAYGWNLFQQRPWFGYGFDSLASVIGEFGKLGHMHDGYLDLLVRGGIVAVALYLVVLVRAIYRLMKLTARTPQAAFWLMFLVGDMAFEVAEATLMRPVNIVWLLFLISAIVAEKDGVLQQAARPDDARVRSRGHPIGGRVAFPNLMR
jgi:O-antigen ligase